MGCRTESTHGFSTPRESLEEDIRCLGDNEFEVIAMRDLSRHPPAVPTGVQKGIRSTTAVGRLANLVDAVPSWSVKSTAFRSELRSSRLFSTATLKPSAVTVTE